MHYIYNSSCNILSCKQTFFHSLKIKNLFHTKEDGYTGKPCLCTTNEQDSLVLVEGDDMSNTDTPRCSSVVTISIQNVHLKTAARSPSQWGRQLGSNMTRFPGGLPVPLCRSLCSVKARFKVRPLREPRCHLQMSPFSMSWMCCTMRLMATGETKITCKAFSPTGERLQRSAMYTYKHSPMLSTPLGMITSTYFLVWEEKFKIYFKFT